MKKIEFPAMDELLTSTESLRRMHRGVVEKWRTLSPELQAMVPHVAELIVEGMGGRTFWRDMTAEERNIMSYSVVAVLAEARQRARTELSSELEPG